MNGYLGEIKMFAGNYPPAAWAYCQGQLLAVGSYSSLFAVISNTYGGDGITTFGLPDIRGRTTMGTGTGAGLSPRYLGQYGGYDYVLLNNAHMPAHTHDVHCDTTTTSGRDYSDQPETKSFAINSGGDSYGNNTTGNHTMNSDILSVAGSGYSFNVHQPWLCINHIICTDGNWPPRS